MKHSNYHPTRRQQRGISLVTVLVILLLSLMAVMGAFRVANLNETMLGSTADYNRAYEAAEALMRDAEIDVNGRRPPYTKAQADGSYGWPCRPLSAASATDVAVGFIGCRNQAVANTPWFPNNNEDFDTVSDIVTTNSAQHCKEGICVPLSITEHANIEDNLGTMSPLGATYGQFTRDSLTAPGVSGNPILNCPGGAASTTTCGWYWVELFRYAGGASSAPVVAANVVPEKSRPFVFRITAVALGLKEGTRVVLTSVIVPYTQSQK